MTDSIKWNGHKFGFRFYYILPNRRETNGNIVRVFIVIATNGVRSMAYATQRKQINGGTTAGNVE